MTGVEALAALADPLRRAIYDHVVGSSAPVGRDQAAAALEISRQAAAYHLDRLAEEGLLEVEFRRLSGRTGPGAGRPAKLYRLSGLMLDITLPPRRYELAAKILLEAVGRDDSQSVTEVARRTGRELGRAGLKTALDETGYQPMGEGGETRFRNCPFHALRDQDRETTCRLSLALVEGLIEGSGSNAVAVFGPEEGYCCVRLRGG
jgi:predicted ArsR family transcriptional regulator